MFYKIKEVEPLPDFNLLVHFTKKKYDVKPLFDKWQSFQMLNLPKLFDCVRVDNGGYGIVWNDELDLSANELWDNGKTIIKH